MSRRNEGNKGNFSLLENVVEIIMRSHNLTFPSAVELNLLPFLLFLWDYEKGVDIRGDAMPTQSAVTLKHQSYHGHESSLIVLPSPLSR